MGIRFAPCLMPIAHHECCIWYLEGPKLDFNCCEAGQLCRFSCQARTSPIGPPDKPRGDVQIQECDGFRIKDSDQASCAKIGVVRHRGRVLVPQVGSPFRFGDD